MTFFVPDHLIAKPPKPNKPSPEAIRADEVAATEAYALIFAPALRRLLRDFFELKGRDARNSLASVWEAAAFLREEIAPQLPGTLRQALFRRLANDRIKLEQPRIRRHVAVEEAAWTEEVAEAFLQEQVADMAEDWADQAAVRQALANGQREIAFHGQEAGHHRRRGLSPRPGWRACG